MKKANLLVSSFSLVLVLASSPAVFARNHSMDTGGQLVEIPVDTLLAPVQGFDENDDVQVVLHGHLPNSCYRLHHSQVDRGSQPGEFKVKQFAAKRTDGVCGNDHSMPEHYKLAAPFTNVVSIGSLPSGTYDFNYTLNGDRVGKRLLTVGTANQAREDDYPYAAVSSVSTADVIHKEQGIRVTLSGVLTSSCSYLDTKNIQIEKLNDVYVVKPVLRIKTGVMCIQSLTPFSRTVELGSNHQVGDFLIHVRSMNGMAVNKVVEIMDN